MEKPSADTKSTSRVPPTLFAQPVHGRMRKGLYVAYNMSTSFTHKAVLDIGDVCNLAKETNNPSTDRILIHMSSDNGVEALPFADYKGDWWWSNKIYDIEEAKNRIKEYALNPQWREYHPTNNNCEHFANYVAYGRRYTSTVSTLHQSIYVIAIIGPIVAAMNFYEWVSNLGKQQS